MFTRKFNCQDPKEMPLHESHGWLDSVRAYKSQLHEPNGVLFFDMLDLHFRDTEEPIRLPWSGMWHSVIKYPDNPHNINRLHASRVSCLSDSLQKPWIKESLSHCVGLFTLSPRLTRFVNEKTGIQTETLGYAIADYKCEFDMAAYLSSPRVFHAGQYQRNYQPFFDLSIPQKKTLVMLDFWKESQHYANTNSVELLSVVPIEDYIKMLCSSIVFLNHYCDFACTVVIQCIKLNTPVCVNKTETNVYYLGEDYPLFYQSVEEANQKLSEQKVIEAAHSYLKNLDKTRYTLKHFVSELANSSTYKSITARRLL